jgi:hypothetical protein
LTSAVSKPKKWSRWGLLVTTLYLHLIWPVQFSHLKLLKTFSKEKRCGVECHDCLRTAFYLYLTSPVTLCKALKTSSNEKRCGVGRMNAGRWNHFTYLHEFVFEQFSPITWKSSSLFPTKKGAVKNSGRWHHFTYLYLTSSVTLKPSRLFPTKKVR